MEQHGSFSPFGYARFNGAVIFRSRMDRVAALAPALAGQLQWSRDLSITDGSPCKNVVDTITVTLQWSRDLSITDGRFASWSILVVAYGFNGAVIFRSRMGFIRANCRDG